MIETSPGVLTETFFHEGGNKLLVWHHGTPAPRPMSPEMADLFASYGFTVAIPVRQGYINSTAVGRRNVAEDAKVTEHIVDYLGFTEFRTIGYSGGGSRALADLALNDKCIKGMTFAPLVPTTLDVFNPFTKASEEDLHFIQKVRDWDQNLEEMFQSEAKKMLAEDPLAGFNDADEDTKAWLKTPDALFRFQQTTLGIETGVMGWMLDEYSLLTDYGFDVSSIRKPLKIITGDKDTLVDMSCSVWLQTQVPESELHILEGMGHSRVFAIDVLDEMLADF